MKPATIALLICTVCSACSGVRMHGSPGSQVPGLDTPNDQSRPPRAGTLGAAGGSAESKVACRSAGRSRDWVAVDYVPLSGCSGADAKREFAGAVLVRIDQRALGSQVRVCSDQSFPSSWTRERDTDPSPACPREPGASTEAPATMSIRRVQ